MSWPLFRRIAFDLRRHLFGTCLILFLFCGLWVKITDRFANEIIPALLKKISYKDLMAIIFEGSGKFLQTLLGGDSMNFSKAGDIMTIHTIHPLILTILSLWCIGKGASTLAGETDKGTMELLLAQPIARWKIITTHLLYDLLTLPLLFLSMFLGAWLGLTMIPIEGVTLHGYSTIILHGFALCFALTGLMTFLSSLSRSRNRVLAWGTGMILIFFLLHFLGQLWEPLAPWRPLSLFYYYQPQQILLQQASTINVWGLQTSGMPILLGIGIVGYLAAIVVFQKKDIPSPL